ncbi:MAG: hypothetical protein AAGF95_11860 [Chloroflexota bacterium]
MKEFYNYNEWVKQVQYDNDEFSYRYIFDAYLLAQKPYSTEGMYYTCETRTRVDGTVEYVIIDRHNDCALVVKGDQGMVKLVEYLIRRFCPQTRDMEAWHKQQHEWARENLTSYE